MKEMAQIFMRLPEVSNKRYGLIGIGAIAILYLASAMISQLRDNLGVALSLLWILFVPYGIGRLALKLPIAKIKQIEIAVNGLGHYKTLTGWSVGFIVIIPSSLLLLEISSATWIGLVLLAVASASVLTTYQITFIRSKFNKRLAILLLIPLVLGSTYAGYIRSFSPYPLSPGLDVFTHLYVAKGIINNSLDSPLLYAPAFDTLIALSSASSMANLTGVFWAGSFLITPIFAISTFALAYRYTRSIPTALVSTVIALSITEQGFVPNMQSFYPSSFVMAIFPLLICSTDKLWKTTAIGTFHKTAITALTLGAVMVLHFQLGVMVTIIVSILIVTTRHFKTRQAAIVDKVLRVSTVTITTLLILYYFSLFNLQIEAKIADGQYSYAVPMKVKLLKDWYTDQVMIIFFAGLFLMSLFKNRGILTLAFIASALMLLYFQKIDIIHRFLALERPMLSVVAGMALTWPAIYLLEQLAKPGKFGLRHFALGKIRKFRHLQTIKNTTTMSIIYSTLAIMIIFPTLMQPFDSYVSAYAQHNTSFSNFTTEEVTAANWIEKNTPPHYTLYSDPFTVLEMRGLAYRKNIEAISWNHTVAEIVKSGLTANNSALAYNTISSQFGYDNIIVITPRTSIWLKGTDYLVQFPVNAFSTFNGFNNFFDQKYFTLVYRSDNIYVFLQNNPADMQRNK